MKQSKIIIAALFLIFPFAAHAGPILCATGATVNSGGSNSQTPITNTIDQSGLSSGFTCGVTDFDAYIATDPSHTLGFTSEWFSDSGNTDDSVVTYDLGSAAFVDGLALWNEESSGIGSLDLFGSLNGVDFFAISLGITPFDNPLADYLPEVFDFASIELQFIRFDMFGCPQLDPAAYDGCAIGEVAFRQGDATTTAVPEPGALALLGLGLAGMGMARRKK